MPAKDEFSFINHLRTRIKSGDKRIISQIGDDAAVIRQSGDRDLVVTTDLLVEDIDFIIRLTTPRLLGHKALAVSLSDIAAMGAHPKWALLSIGVPEKTWRSKFLDQFYDGYLELASVHKVSLVGGDISRTTAKIAIDSIVVGETYKGQAIKRSGARPGDRIFITGSLGGAAAALRLLKQLSRTQLNKRSTAGNSRDSLILRQLAPDARVGWGIVLGDKRLASAMIDISDGLSSDLHHLCVESKVGATIDAGALPIDRAIKALALADPLALALHGGEDFELLFTVPQDKVPLLPRSRGGVPVTEIGRITRSKGLFLLQDGKKRSLQPRGFKHF